MLRPFASYKSRPISRGSQPLAIRRAKLGNGCKNLTNSPRRRSSHSLWFPQVSERRPSSDPGRAPLPSRWGASEEPPPVRDPASPPSSSPVAQALKHRKRWDNRRDELLRLSLRLSKLSRCFLLAFDGVTSSTEQRSACSVNGPDLIDKRMGTEEWLDSFVRILLSIRSSPR
jgi:hypothetical protein